MKFSIIDFFIKCEQTRRFEEILNEKLNVLCSVTNANLHYEMKNQTESS